MSRLKAEVRKDQLLKAALKVASRGYRDLTRRSVAEEAQVSESLVSAHWGTMPQLRRSVMRQAVKDGNLAVVAQGLSMRDPVAMKAPLDLKEKAAASLV